MLGGVFVPSMFTSPAGVSHALSEALRLSISTSIISLTSRISRPPEHASSEASAIRRPNVDALGQRRWAAVRALTSTLPSSTDHGNTYQRSATSSTIFMIAATGPWSCAAGELWSSSICADVRAQRCPLDRRRRASSARYAARIARRAACFGQGAGRASRQRHGRRGSWQLRFAPARSSGYAASRNGQTELMHALAGMQPIQSGEIVYALGSGPPAKLRTLRPCAGSASLIFRRIVFIMRLLPRSALTMNWLLRKLCKPEFITLAIFAASGGGQGDAGRYKSQRCPRLRAASACPISGRKSARNSLLPANFGDDAAVILAGHPTRRSRHSDRRYDPQSAFIAERAKSVAILLLSADLSRFRDLADRVLVMTQGKLRGPVPVGETSLAEIGHWMTAP